MTISRRTACVTLSATLMSKFVGAAEAYPSRSARIIVPYPPGGFNDVLGRTLADNLTRLWANPVIVDNRPGGNTVLGNNIAAKSQPDGYTMLITPLPFASLPALYGAKLPYDALRDFEPVIQAASTQNALVIKPGLPFNDVRGLIEYAKANPDRLNYGSPGAGSSVHLCTELFKKMTGTRMTHVPYKGSGPMMVALLGGEIDLFFDNVPNVVQQVRAGRIKALAVSGSARTELLPDTPTVAMAGVPGFDVTVWFGVQMPSGVSREVVNKANADIASVLRSPEVVKRFREQGVEVVASTPGDFSALVRREVAKWTRLVDEAKITVD